MSQIMVAELVLSEVESGLVPGFHLFSGGCCPRHGMVCREDTPVLTDCNLRWSSPVS